MADEWDIFASKSNSKNYTASSNSTNGNGSTLSDDEDEDGGVALQYIVHDNGDLEVVQRAMPSASFSDRRSVDTPVPQDEIHLSHPDALECANASRGSLHLDGSSLVPNVEIVENSVLHGNTGKMREKLPGHYVAHDDAGSKSISKDGTHGIVGPASEGITLSNKGASLIATPSNASPIVFGPSMVVAQPSTSQMLTSAPNTINYQPAMPVPINGNFQYCEPSRVITAASSQSAKGMVAISRTGEISTLSASLSLSLSLSQDKRRD